MKIDAAWYGVLVLLGLGMAASILKGLDWREALTLGAMFLAMLASHRHFYRKSSLLKISLNPAWIVMTAIVISGSVWLGFFSYKHIEYSNDLW